VDRINETAEAVSTYSFESGSSTSGISSKDILPFLANLALDTLSGMMAESGTMPVGWKSVPRPSNVVTNARHQHDRNMVSGIASPEIAGRPERTAADAATLRPRDTAILSRGLENIAIASATQSHAPMLGALAAVRQNTAGGTLTKEDELKFADEYYTNPDTAIRKAAKESGVGGALDPSISTVDILAGMAENVSGSDMSNKADIAKALEGGVPAGPTPKHLDEIKRDADAKAAAITRIGSTAAGSFITDQIVDLAESKGIQASNYQPEKYMGRGLYDAAAATSGYRTPDAESILKTRDAVVNSLYNENGQIRTEISHGASVKDIADTAGVFAKRGMVGNTLSAAVSAGDVGGVDASVSEMSSAAAALRKLFGPGGSIDELMGIMDEVTKGGASSMGGGRVEALANKIQRVATGAGLSVQDVLEAGARGSTYAISQGAVGIVGTMAGIDAANHAAIAVRNRKGDGGFGSRTAEELTAEVTKFTVDRLTGDDGVMAGAALHTLRQQAAADGLADSDNMTWDQLTSHYGMSNKTPTAATHQEFSETISAKFGAGAVGRLNSAIAFNPLEVQGATHDMRSEIMAAHREEMFDAMAENVASDTGVNKKLAHSVVSDIIRSGTRDTAGKLEIMNKHGITSKEKQLDMLSAINNAASFDNMSGDIGTMQDLYSDKTIEDVNTQEVLGKAYQGIDKTLTAAGVGAGSFFDRIANDLLAGNSPEEALKKRLSSGITPEALELFKPLEEFHANVAAIEKGGGTPQEKAAKIGIEADKIAAHVTENSEKFKELSTKEIQEDITAAAEGGDIPAILADEARKTAENTEGILEAVGGSTKKTKDGAGDSKSEVKSGESGGGGSPGASGGVVYRNEITTSTDGASGVNTGNARGSTVEAIATR
jgi:hypothetical protein